MGSVVLGRMRDLPEWHIFHDEAQDRNTCGVNGPYDERTRAGGCFQATMSIE
jgi:hypothetical protein